MKRFLLIALLFFGAVEVNAQVLTLEDAINIALKNSLDIQLARNNIEASHINNHISVAGGLPTVTGSLTDNQAITNLNQKLSNGTTTIRSGNAINNLNSGITASFIVSNGFRVYAARSRLRALERLSEQQVVMQIQNIVANVMVKYYDIVRQQSYINTIQQAINVTFQQKQIIEARQSVGLANNADKFQAQLDLNAAQQELLSQELVLNQSKTDMMTLLTQRPDSSFVIRDTIVVDSTIQVQMVLDSLQNNPELSSAEQQIRINEFIVREVRAQRYPAISLNTGYNYNRNQNAAGFTLLNQTNGPFIGLNVQVPIFNGGLLKRQERVARIDIRNAAVTRETLLNNMKAATVQAWQVYRNNLNRLQAERENNRVAAALLDLTLKRLELSAATIIEVREAQRSFVEAGYRLVNFAYAAKVAEIELKRIASQLL
ncbi:MAG TPA: TolC family protein [Segetibacter sp.]|nr:TolC family protein [Segetibacter sp.]